MNRMTIHKYVLPPEDYVTIDMPLGAEVLHFNVQHLVQDGATHAAFNLCIWAKVKTGNPTEPRHFRLAGTGHMLAPDLHHHYLGTILMEQGTAVLHLFQIPYLPGSPREDF